MLGARSEGEGQYSKPIRGCAPGKGLGQEFEEFARFDPQRVRESDDVQERDVTLVPFNSAYLLNCDVSLPTQLVSLARGLVEGRVAHVHSERSSRVGEWHAVIIRLVTTICLHRMSAIHTRLSARANCPRVGSSQKSFICRVRPSLS